MAYMSTMPGFSSRTSVHIVTQFPQRDERMSEHDDELHAPGFSNSEPAKDAPEDVQPDVQAPEELEPGFSNAKAVKSDAAPAPEADATTDIDDPADPDPKPTAKKTAAKKTAAKSAAKKG